MGQFFTAPEMSEVIVRSRELEKGKLLDPPADWPVVFSCRYRGQPSIGTVFLNGITVIMPNRFSRDAYTPVVVPRWCDVEAMETVTDLCFEWQVTRSPRDSGEGQLRVADTP